MTRASAPRRLCSAGFLVYMCYTGTQTTAGPLFWLMLPVSLAQLYLRASDSLAARTAHRADWVVRIAAAFMLLPCVLISPIWAIILASAWYSKQKTINDMEYHAHLDTWNILVAVFLKFSDCAFSGVV